MLWDEGCHGRTGNSVGSEDAAGPGIHGGTGMLLGLGILRMLWDWGCCWDWEFCGVWGCCGTRGCCGMGNSAGFADAAGAGDAPVGRRCCGTRNVSGSEDAVVGNSAASEDAAGPGMPRWDRDAVGLGIPQGLRMLQWDGHAVGPGILRMLRDRGMLRDPSASLPPPAPRRSRLGAFRPSSFPQPLRFGLWVWEAKVWGSLNPGQQHLCLGLGALRVAPRSPSSVPFPREGGVISSVCLREVSHRAWLVCTSPGKGHAGKKKIRIKKTKNSWRVKANSGGESGFSPAAEGAGWEARWVIRPRR